MKKYILSFLGAVLAIAGNAQIMDVCGTDSVILELHNYRDGIIQWEMSESDTVNWIDLEGETGLTYNFRPAEQRFIRAKVLTTECEPIYTPISFIQLPPVANAGSDRNCGNTEIFLTGNTQIGSIGSWSIIHGTGIIEDIYDRHSKFSGNYGDSVALVWTLTNSCGSSSDTISLVFEELVSITEDEFLVVDITDSICSTPEEIANGIYKIIFSDPGITANEDIFLIGIRDDISFLRKVTAFTLQNGMYTFVTVNAQLEDLFTSGTLNMGDAVNQSMMSKDGGLLPEIEGFPTRKTFKSFAKNKGILPLYVTTTYDPRYPEMRNTAKYDQAKGFVIPIPSIPIYESDHISLSVDDAYISIDPNFVLDLNVEWFSLKYIKVGVENSGFEYGYSTVLEITGSETISDWEKPLYETSKISYFMAGSVPVVVETNFDITATFGAEVSGTVSFDRSVVNSRTLTAYLEGTPGNFNTVYSSTNTQTQEFDFSAEGHLSAELSIGPSISFMAYGIVGPYLEVPLTASADACMDFTSGNWTATAGLAISGNLGARGEILGQQIFDFSQEIFNLPIGDEIVIPNKIELISGYNQLGEKGLVLPQPVVVRVKSSMGFAVPFFPVRVELTDGNGSSDHEVYISDISGNVYIYWTLGTNNKNEMTVYANDCEGEDFNNSPLNVIAYTPDYISDCNNSNINIGVYVSHSKQTVYIYTSGGYPPYQYSTDGLNWSTELPYFNYFVTGNFTVYVKDIYDCIASRSFSIQASNYCRYSTLSLTYTQEGTNVTLTGSGGYPPYEYSWGDQSNYGPNRYFNNLIPGTYLAYVHDSRGCQKSNTITIPVSAVDPLHAIYPNDMQQNVGVETIAFIWVSGTYAFNQTYDFYLNNSLIAGNLSDPEYIYQQTLEYETGYTWKIVVKNQSGEEIHFKEFSFTTIAYSPPVPNLPVIIQPLNSVLMDTLSYTFKWAPQDEMVYHFYCDTISGNMLNATNLTASEYTVNRLINFSDYFWKIAVKNPITGVMVESPVYEFSTDTIEMPVSTDLTYPAAGLVVNQLPLEFLWESQGNDFVYDLYLDQTDASTLYAENLTSNTYQATNLVDLQAWFWKVRAKNTLNGLWVESPVWEFSTDTATVPDFNLQSPSNTEVLSVLPTNLIWDDLGTEYTYTLYLDETDATTQIADNLVSNTYALNDLTDLRTYYWKIKAVKISNSNYKYSGVWSFDTDTIQIPDVELISPSNNFVSTANNLILTWSALGPEYTYSVFMDTNDATTMIAQDLTVNNFNVENLIDLTTYKWKVVATNTICNRSKSSLIYTIYTGFSEIVQDVDGNTYSTVIINSKKWFRENLKTTSYSDGTPIPDGTGIGDYFGETEPKYYFNYNDLEANVSVYGRQYTWFTVTDAKGVCPLGWHVPSSSEMDAMRSGYIGGNLKEAGTEHWLEPNTDADNLSGFTALPSGSRHSYGFNWLGTYGIFWTATESDSTNARKRELHAGDNGFWMGLSDKKTGYAVRCVKD